MGVVIAGSHDAASQCRIQTFRYLAASDNVSIENKRFLFEE